MIFGTMHHNQPRFPFFFIYLYSGWILFLDLDLVSSGKDGKKKEKKETIFQGFDSTYVSRDKETFRDISPPRFSPPQRFFKVQRIWQKYRRHGTHCSLPLIPHSYLPNEFAFTLVQDNSQLYCIGQRNGFTLSRAHVSSPPYLHVTLKFRANNSSSIRKGEEKRNFNITSVKTKFDSYHLSSCIYKSR